MCPYFSHIKFNVALVNRCGVFHKSFSLSLTGFILPILPNILSARWGEGGGVRQFVCRTAMISEKVLELKKSALGPRG